ncbi:hypothetical protein TSUD_361140 [Trifolium subterraneum]|uniref:Transmembrane protein n=1 Tax=Trifolium subterraneum TaxID=3900 RepID=A0A2Z6P182_TRISU|nr:hypothetical protein TSUD_361140 [Trifolium subterraneum]
MDSLYHLLSLVALILDGGDWIFVFDGGWFVSIVWFVAGASWWWCWFQFYGFDFVWIRSCCFSHHCLPCGGDWWWSLVSGGGPSTSSFVLIAAVY